MVLQSAKAVRHLCVVLFLFIAIPASAQPSLIVGYGDGTCINNAFIEGTVDFPGGDPASFEFRLLATDSTQIRGFQSSGLFEFLPAGDYLVQASDGTSTVTSGILTLRSLYVSMSARIDNGTIYCAGADTSLRVNISGGRAPYTYKIIAGPVTRPDQSSPLFSGLGAGAYTFSITDSCGVTITAAAGISRSTLTTSDIIPFTGQGFIHYGHRGTPSENNCDTGTFVRVENWIYRSTGNTAVSPEDQANFYWRYRYPAGSGNIYGAGGVLNGPKVPAIEFELPAPATASYPYTKGDIIVYDRCGDSTLLPGALSALTPANGRRMDVLVSTACDGTGGTMQHPLDALTLTCLPIYYTFTDSATGVVRHDTADTWDDNYHFIRRSGFTPGHTYYALATDANGNSAFPFVPEVLRFPSKATGLRVYFTVPEPSVINGRYVVLELPGYLPARSLLSFRVIASSSGKPAVGYTNSHTTGDRIFWICHDSCTWRPGTYTVVLNSGCLTDDTLTFTVEPGYVAYMRPGSINAVCGGFNFTAKALLDHPEQYEMRLMWGSSSGVGQSRTFDPVAESPGLYRSLSFEGLSYGTYHLGLFVKGYSVPLSMDTITFEASDAISIDALRTGGYLCPGSTTGTLSISATSSSGSSLSYSRDGGASYQSSAVFTGNTAGVYQVRVKDTCGNMVSITTSVIGSSGIRARINGSADSAAVCAGRPVQLQVNAPGATSYTWTGPGFGSSAQNPLISAATADGSYQVSVNNGSCVIADSVKLILKSNPVAVIGMNCVVPVSLRLVENGSDSNKVWNWSSASGGMFYPDSTYNPDSAAATSSLKAPYIKKTGDYTVKVTGDNGCETTESISIGLSDCAAVLPLELLDFSGKAEGCRALLSWKTAREARLAYFELQQSKDGIHFNTVTRINSNQIQSGSSYSYLCTQTCNRAYYRLKLVYTDGGTSFSNTEGVSVSCNTNTLELFPQPVRELLHIRISGPLSTAGYTLSDLSGRKLLSGTFDTNACSIDTRNLPGGMYLLEISTGQEQWVRKVLK